MEERQLLAEPFGKLGFSPEFCMQAKTMGFDVLEDILVLKPEELLLRPGFSFGWLGELTAFLTRRGLLHLLQPIPGRSGDRSF
jgi:hypothetical protein